MTGTTTDANPPPECPVCGEDLVELDPSVVPAFLWDVWGNAQQARVGLIRHGCPVCRFVLIDTAALADLAGRQRTVLAEGRAQIVRQTERVRRMDLRVMTLVVAAALGLGVLIGAGVCREPTGGVLAGLLSIAAVAGWFYAWKPIPKPIR